MVDTPLPGSMPHRRRYHRWSTEEKRSICRETRAPGLSVAQVARRHALNANLIFKWLKDRRFAHRHPRALDPGGPYACVKLLNKVMLTEGGGVRLNKAA